MSKLEKILEIANKSRKAELLKEDLVMPSKVKQVETGVPNPYLTVATSPDSPINEEYRKLKSWLVRAANKNSWRTFVITSAHEGAGKTLTSINLSLMLAKEPNTSVLLIDGDMRQKYSSIKKFLSIKTDKGLSDYLDSEVELSEVLVQTSWDNLFVIPAGTLHPNPSEILPDQYVAKLVSDIKRTVSCRYVIIDTPPVLLFSDPTSFGVHVDGVIFVVREGKTNIKKVQIALTSLKECNVIGIVYNCATFDPMDSDFRYYYRYRNR